MSLSGAVLARDLFCLYPTPAGHVAALRGLTLDVGAGERVLVHGPNGSGKTTLLRVLTGQVAPSAGVVTVCSVDLAGAGGAALAGLRGRQLGLVTQQSALSLRPELRVVDNVALQSRLLGSRRGPARRDATTLLASLGLGALARRWPATLSGGEAQRVAVCAAVAHSPSLILADEPTGSLDREAADAVYDLLATAAATVGAALLVVSHDPLAARIADRIVRIRDGRLSEEWTPDSPATGSPATDAQPAESLVVDDRGWVRLPEPLRREVGLGSRARATVAGGVLALSPASPGSATAAEPATVPSAPGTAPSAPGAEGAVAVGAVAPGEIVARVRGVGTPGVLTDIDLSLRAGTLTVVRGRSGSGKTTLLNILCGLARPATGVVTVTGVELTTLDRAGLAALRRRAVAVSSQVTALVETADVVENLALARLARGLPPDPARLDSLIGDLGLAGVRGRAVRVLSGGERQRVAVARVLALAPVLAVLDEPTSHQDEAHAEIVVAALVAAARSGMAVAVASHDPVLVGAADATLTLA